MTAGIFSLEILRALEVIAGWWLLFILLNPPPTKVRRVSLIAAFPLLYAFWYFIPINVWFAPGTRMGSLISDDIVNELLWAAIILFFALLNGNLRNSLFSAFWYIGIEQNLDVLRAFLNRLVNDGFYVGNYPQYNAQYFLLLGWAYFYYRVRRKCAETPPFLFQCLTALTPLSALFFLSHYADTIRMAPRGSRLLISLCLDGALMGIIFLVFNLAMFYLYVKLFIAYSAKEFAMATTHTEPLWTEKAGLSEAFIITYKLTKRERALVEMILSGKGATYKEMARALDLSVKTIETYMRSIYMKTGAVNMVALYSLIKG